MGWHEFSRSVTVAGDFSSARAALLDWQVHRRAGLTVDARSPIRLGEHARLTWQWGPIRVTAPVIIVEVSDTGFTYEALPGHPEEGRETFSLIETDDGTTVFTISARSRPAVWWARIGAPVTGLVQRQITDRYLQAARALGEIPRSL